MDRYSAASQLLNGYTNQQLCEVAKSLGLDERKDRERLVHEIACVSTGAPATTKQIRLPLPGPKPWKPSASAPDLTDIQRRAREKLQARELKLAKRLSRGETLARRVKENAEKRLLIRQTTVEKKLQEAEREKRQRILDRMAKAVKKRGKPKRFDDPEAFTMQPKRRSYATCRVCRRKSNKLVNFICPTCR